jgi:hypothetical protein
MLTLIPAKKSVVQREKFSWKEVKSKITKPFRYTLIITTAIVLLACTAYLILLFALLPLTPAGLSFASLRTYTHSNTRLSLASSGQTSYYSADLLGAGQTQWILLEQQNLFIFAQDEQGTARNYAEIPSIFSNFITRRVITGNFLGEDRDSLCIFDNLYIQCGKVIAATNQFTFFKAQNQSFIDSAYQILNYAVNNDNLLDVLLIYEPSTGAVSFYQLTQRFAAQVEFNLIGKTTLLAQRALFALRIHSFSLDSSDSLLLLDESQGILALYTPSAPTSATTFSPRSFNLTFESGANFINSSQESLSISRFYASSADFLVIHGFSSGKLRFLQPKLLNSGQLALESADFIDSSLLSPFVRCQGAQTQCLLWANIKPAISSDELAEIIGSDDWEALRSAHSDYSARQDLIFYDSSANLFHFISNSVGKLEKSQILPLFKKEFTQMGLNGALLDQDLDLDGISTRIELGQSAARLDVLHSHVYQRDIFVEIDFMEDKTRGISLRPAPEALQSAEFIYSQHNISLHTLVNDSLPWKSSLSTGIFDWNSHFYHYKTQYFTAERLGTFRYCLWVNSYDGSTGSGRAIVPGQDLIVSLGNWPNYGGISGQLGTFMHELGHNIGLYHGGSSGDDTINKPNHLSVMNYLFQIRGVPSGDGTRHFDYQSFDCGDLNQLELDEKQGINCSQGPGQYFQSILHGSTGKVVPVNRPLDFNGNSKIDEGRVQFDLIGWHDVNEKTRAKPMLTGGKNEWNSIDLVAGLSGAPEISLVFKVALNNSTAAATTAAANNIKLVVENAVGDSSSRSKNIPAIIVGHEEPELDLEGFSWSA